MTKVRKRASKPPSQQVTTTVTSTIADVPLSPQWAFVVQFRATPGGAVFEAGRIEHLVSGRTSHFQSLEELRACLCEELGAAASVAKQ
ncbi:MAG: hypothetical protein AB7G75_17545 [Candidatus Binatia bacterium]